jgi:hypothetical protein
MPKLVNVKGLHLVADIRKCTELQKEILNAYLNSGSHSLYPGGMALEIGIPSITRKHVVIALKKMNTGYFGLRPNGFGGYEMDSRAAAYFSRYFCLVSKWRD